MWERINLKFLECGHSGKVKPIVGCMKCPEKRGVEMKGQTLTGNGNSGRPPFSSIGLGDGAKFLSKKSCTRKHGVCTNQKWQFTTARGEKLLLPGVRSL